MIIEPNFNYVQLTISLDRPAVKSKNYTQEDSMQKKGPKFKSKMSYSTKLYSSTEKP